MKSKLGDRKSSCSLRIVVVVVLVVGVAVEKQLMNQAAAPRRTSVQHG